MRIPKNTKRIIIHHGNKSGSYWYNLSSKIIPFPFTEAYIDIAMTIGNNSDGFCATFKVTQDNYLEFYSKDEMQAHGDNNYICAIEFQKI